MYHLLADPGPLIDRYWTIARGITDCPNNRSVDSRGAMTRQSSVIDRSGVEPKNKQP
jgi:hypothetical protein